MKEVKALSNATGDESVHEIIYTTNKATSGNDTGLKVTQTDTASPGISRLMDLLVGVIRQFSVNNAGFIENAVGANVPSGATITPTGPIFHITGVTQVNTINIPYTGFSGSIIIIPDGIFAFGTSGNIALATTTIVGKPILLTYDTNTSKWYQSDIPLSTEVLAGITEIATQAETNAGVDDARIVTPLKLATNFVTHPVGDLSDVDTTGEVVDNVLRFNGTNWVPGDIPISAGTGSPFFLVDTAIVPGLFTLSKDPDTGVEDIDTVTVNLNTLLIEPYLFNTALGGTQIDAGIWEFDTYLSVNNTGGGVSTCRINIYRVMTGAGTITTTGAGTSRTATVTGGTPFISGDANAAVDVASYLQTPSGVFKISAFTSSSVVTITTLVGYVNEAGVAYSVHRRLFQVITATIATTTVALYSTLITEPAFPIDPADKLSVFYFGSTTAGANRIISLYHSGTLHYTHFHAPLTIRHNDLAGLQGGTTNEFYHTTANQNAAITGAAAPSGSNVFATINDIPAASETVAGKAEIATQTETNAGVDDARFITPLKFASRTATETRTGILEIATQAETNAGTEDGAIVTPLKLGNFEGFIKRLDIKGPLAGSYNNGEYVLALEKGADGYGLYFGVLGSGNTFIQAGRMDNAAVYDLVLNPNGGTISLMSNVYYNLFTGGGVQNLAVGNNGIAQISPTPTETQIGPAEIATQAEVTTGTDDQRIVTPLKLATAVPAASETAAGKAEIATQAEVTTGTDDLRIVTPLKLATAVPAASETAAGKAEIATQAETDTGTDDARIVTPLKLATAVPAASETAAGKAEIATQTETNTGTDDARIVTPLKLKVNIASKAFYNVQFTAPQQNPATNQVLALGQYTPAMAPGMFGTERVYLPKAGRITRAIIYWRAAGTAGSGENITISIRLNNSTDTAIATVGTTAADKIFSKLDLNITIADSDYIELKVTTPIWVTAPTNVKIYGNIIIEPSA